MPSEALRGPTSAFYSRQVFILPFPIVVFDKKIRGKKRTFHAQKSAFYPQNRQNRNPYFTINPHIPRYKYIILYLSPIGKQKKGLPQ
jgi:hypothetical protein